VTFPYYRIIAYRTQVSAQTKRNESGPRNRAPPLNYLPRCAFAARAPPFETPARLLQTRARTGIIGTRRVDCDIDAPGVAFGGRWQRLLRELGVVF